MKNTIKVGIKNIKDLSYMDYIEKKVKGDGKCYFRVQSYYYRNDEKFYNEFRKLIHELFFENLEKFIEFFPDSDIFKEKPPENKEESLKLLKKIRQ